MYARFLKRPLDFFCALAAILALSPLLLVLTVLGAVKMKGNPFFTQPRLKLLIKNINLIENALENHGCFKMIIHDNNILKGTLQCIEI